MWLSVNSIAVAPQVGDTPLHTAAAEGILEVIRLLLQYDSDHEITNAVRIRAAV